MEYYDGNAVRIQETRRRGPAFTTTGKMTSRHRKRSINKSEQVTPTQFLDLDVQNVDSNPDTVRSGGPGVSRHVTSTVSSSKTSAKPVVYQASSSTNSEDKEAIAPPAALAMPTPPPTPKVDRLPTPELPELDDSPFCDCCVEVHVVKYCASCGVDLNRH